MVSSRFQRIFNKLYIVFWIVVGKWCWIVFPGTLLGMGHPTVATSWTFKEDLPIMKTFSWGSTVFSDFFKDTSGGFRCIP